MAETWKFIGIVSLRLFASLLCGAVVGFERKRRAKKAGIRTHCLVALGAAIFGIISKYGFLDLISEGSSADIARVAANVVTGVSFLGAGVIFLRNRSVSGLTTAAGIWSVSAVGLAFGCGLYTVGIVGTFGMVFCQYVIYRPLRKLEGHTPRQVQARLAPGEGNLDSFIEVIKSIDREVTVNSLTKHPDGSIDIVCGVRSPNDPVVDIVEFMKKHTYVTQMNT